MRTCSLRLKHLPISRTNIRRLEIWRRFEKQTTNLAPEHFARFPIEVGIPKRHRESPVKSKIRPKSRCTSSYGAHERKASSNDRMRFVVRIKTTKVKKSVCDQTCVQGETNLPSGIQEHARTRSRARYAGVHGWNALRGKHLPHQ
jgi:hypothetical protein